MCRVEFSKIGKRDVTFIREMRVPIYYPIFEDHFLVFKEFFQEYSVLTYGYYSRLVCNQERVMIASGRYSIVPKKASIRKLDLHS